MPSAISICRVTSVFLLLVSSLIAQPSAFGSDLSVSLPLGPWYRPGKYIPVHVTASLTSPGKHRLGLAAANVSAAADISQGAGRDAINLADGRVDAVVPWFVTDGRAKHPRLFVEESFEFIDGPELKLLGESERLVGWTTPDEPFARQLLHGPPKLIPIALDPAQPIKGNPAAWEMLDAVILDADSGARLDESQIAGLLAGGVTIAIRTDRPPFPGWPWKRQGEYAVLKYDPAGPDGTGSTAAGFHEKAFLPIVDWQAGRPWEFRRRVLIIAAVCCILLLAIALWRPRMTWLWTLALTGAITFALGKWWATTATVQQAGGEIIVLNDGGLTQTDAWTYQTSSAPRPSTLQWSDITRPIFASRGGADDIWISLSCDSTGRPTQFDIRIPANRKLAFLSRTAGPHSPKTQPNPTITSPLTPFANEIYLKEGGKIPGQLPAAATPQFQQWNAVIIDRRTSPGSVLPP